MRYTKNQVKANKTINDLKNWILAEGVICKDKSDDGWGLYGKQHSLNFASAPGSILSPLFSQETINADITELINRQKNDGRWGTWYGISEGTKLEWAGMHTMWVLRALEKYGRIGHARQPMQTGYRTLITTI